jgi:hypothetical protein
VRGRGERISRAQVRAQLAGGSAFVCLYDSANHAGQCLGVEVSGSPTGQRRVRLDNVVLEDIAHVPSGLLSAAFEVFNVRIAELFQRAAFPIFLCASDRFLGGQRVSLARGLFAAQVRVQVCDAGAEQRGQLCGAVARLAQ